MKYIDIMMKDTWSFDNHLFDYNVGLRYLSNMNKKDKWLVLQAIEVSQRHDVVWVDHIIPGSNCDPHEYGCVAVRIPKNGIDCSSFWEAYRNIKNLSR